MATAAGLERDQARDTLAHERRFFLAMALIIAATVFAGFGLNSYRMGTHELVTLPVQVHLHALVFVSWIVFYIAQNALVAGGSVALHRRLGVLGAGIATLMVALGTITTIMAVRRHSVPGFFPPGLFLALDILGVLGFGGLTAWGIALRRRPDWHKRLMLCGTILVMSPALGRILPMPLLGSYAALAVLAAWRSMFWPE